MLFGGFVVVVKAQKLEVCIHKENSMAEKLSEIQFTSMSDDTVSIIFDHNLYDLTENTQPLSR